MENSTEFPKKPKNKTTIWSSNPIPEIYQEKTIIWKDTCAPMCVVVLFTTAKTWKQPKCPSTDEEIKKMWYIYIMEYHSAVKKEQNNAVCSNMGATRDDHAKWDTSEGGRLKSYDSAFIQNLKYTTNTYLQTRNRLTDVENSRLPRGSQGRKEREFGVSGCKLLHTQRINRALLLGHRELYLTSV